MAIASHEASGPRAGAHADWPRGRRAGDATAARLARGSVQGLESGICLDQPNPEDSLHAKRAEMKAVLGGDLGAGVFLAFLGAFFVPSFD